MLSLCLIAGGEQFSLLPSFSFAIDHQSKGHLLSSMSEDRMLFGTVKVALVLSHSATSTVALCFLPSDILQRERSYNGWSMAKDATLGGRGYPCLPAALDVPYTST
jgi:hypothetical protein